MLSSPTIFAPINTLSHYIPSESANLLWLEYVVQGIRLGEISTEDAADIILRTT
jgi:hypothetical protein